MERDILRRMRFAPYRKGMGPTFSLTTWDTHRTDRRGQTIIGYELRMHEPSTTVSGQGIPIVTFSRPRTIVLFTGEDFAGSPMHADDSDACCASLMTFLTLRPGDTDADYFDSYTETQRAFCDSHAEALGCYLSDRFGDR